MPTITLAKTCSLVLEAPRTRYARPHHLHIGIIDSVDVATPFPRRLGVSLRFTSVTILVRWHAPWERLAVSLRITTVASLVRQHALTSTLRTTRTPPRVVW